MYIEINDNTTLREIMDVFSDYYPYLKLSFYKNPHKKYEESKESDLIADSRLIDQIKHTHVSGLIEMTPLNKVKDVEKEFMDRFGLSVQVLRKAKDEWVQTTGMDDFTLKDVNQYSKDSQDQVIISEYEQGFEAPKDLPDKLY